MVDSDQNKLFVGGITRETTAEVLRDHFVSYGPVVDSDVVRDRETGNPRGFGFVSFSDSSAVKKALDATHVILEKTVEVKRATPRSEQHQKQQQNRGFSRNSASNCRSTAAEFRTKKIFVGGLAPVLTEEEFKGYFGQFGRITDVVVMHDNVTNRPRGFGFITFESEDAVEEVTQKSFHELTGKLVEVKKAVPKEGNNSSHNGYNSRGGSGRETFNNYQHGNYTPYSPQCGIVPGYGPLMGYGGFAGYPYGGSVFGGGPGGFPFGGFCGMGYGVTPRSPWNSPAVLGVGRSPSPYGNVATVYPAYMNGRVGVVGVGNNGYKGTEGTGTNGRFTQVRSSDGVEVCSPDIGRNDSTVAQVAADTRPAQMNGNCKSEELDMGGSDGAPSGEQNEEGTDGEARPSPVGKSS